MNVINVRREDMIILYTTCLKLSIKMRLMSVRTPKIHAVPRVFVALKILKRFVVGYIATFSSKPANDSHRRRGLGNMLTPL